MTLRQYTYLWEIDGGLGIYAGKKKVVAKT